MSDALTQAVARRRDVYWRHPRQGRDLEAEDFARGWRWAETHAGDVSAVVPIQEMRNKHFMTGYHDWLLISAVSANGDV